MLTGLQLKNHEPLGMPKAGTKGFYIDKYRIFFGKKQGKSYEI